MYAGYPRRNPDPKFDAWFAEAASHLDEPGLDRHVHGLVSAALSGRDYVCPNRWTREGQTLLQQWADGIGKPRVKWTSKFRIDGQDAITFHQTRSTVAGDDTGLPSRNRCDRP